MFALLLLACVHHEPAAPPPPHGGAAIAARDALLFGDFAGFQRALDLLAAPGAFPGLDPAGTERFQTQVRALRATSEAGAPVALGQLAVACGDCHAVSGSTLIKPEEDPAQGDGVRAEMQRHARGLRIAWSGLLAPSKAALVEASHAFEAGWLSPITGDEDPTVQAFDAAVTAAAEALAAAPDAPTRAQKFGQLVAACQTCHTTRPGGIRIEPE